MKKLFITKGEYGQKGLTRVAKNQLSKLFQEVLGCIEESDVLIVEGLQWVDTGMYICNCLRGEPDGFAEVWIDNVHPQAEKYRDGGTDKKVAYIEVISHADLLKKFPQPHLQGFISHKHNLYLVDEEKFICHKAPYSFRDISVEPLNFESEIDTLQISEKSKSVLRFAESCEIGVMELYKKYKLRFTLDLINNSTRKKKSVGDSLSLIYPKGLDRSDKKQTKNYIKTLKSSGFKLRCRFDDYVDEDTGKIESFLFGDINFIN